MDPNATLQRISDALRTGDTEEAKNAALDLIAWLGMGGFSPDWTEYPISQSYVRWFAAREGINV